MKKVKSFKQFINETFDISTEVKKGDIFYDGQSDQYKVVSVSKSHVELKPQTFKGDNSIFPDDFGKEASIEDFWQYFDSTDISDKLKGSNKLHKQSLMNEKITDPIMNLKKGEVYVYKTKNSSGENVGGEYEYMGFKKPMFRFKLLKSFASKSTKDDYINRGMEHFVVPGGMLNMGKVNIVQAAKKK